MANNGVVAAAKKAARKYVNNGGKRHQWRHSRIGNEKKNVIAQR
jgi:hypothetical protein